MGKEELTPVDYVGGLIRDYKRAQYRVDNGETVVLPVSKTEMILNDEGSRQRWIDHVESLELVVLNRLLGWLQGEEPGSLEGFMALEQQRQERSLDNRMSWEEFSFLVGVVRGWDSRLKR